VGECRLGVDSGNVQQNLPSAFNGRRMSELKRRSMLTSAAAVTAAPLSLGTNVVTFTASTHQLGYRRYR
jgi:hypothetical protein